MFRLMSKQLEFMCLAPLIDRPRDPISLPLPHGESPRKSAQWI